MTLQCTVQYNFFGVWAGASYFIALQLVQQGLRQWQQIHLQVESQGNKVLHVLKLDLTGELVHTKHKLHVPDKLFRLKLLTTDDSMQKSQASESSAIVIPTSLGKFMQMTG